MSDTSILPLDWLSNWFAHKAESIILESDDNYFEKNAIDSFDVIILIEDIENQFDIKFSEIHFQDRRFVTMVGLAMIIEELRGK